MKIRLTTQKPSERTPLIVPVFSDVARSGGGLLADSVAKWASHPVLRKIGKPVCIQEDGRQITLVSMGCRADCDWETMLRVGGAVVASMRTTGSTRVVVDATEVIGADMLSPMQALCEGMTMGSFRFDKHKAIDKGKVTTSTVSLWAPSTSHPLPKEIRDQVARGITVADGVNYARRLAHEPPNLMQPVDLAIEARKLAKRVGLKCRVLDEKQMKQLKMGAFLAVGQGSAAPSRLIVLEYAGGGRRSSSKSSGQPVVLVGKAVTFDTGGYSLKDKQGIVGMKYDKCGGCAVMGVMHAVAKLKPKTPVIGVIAAAENMISSRAYRPNDIITAMSGKTIEIISTDAEGRLVLADTLTYVQRKYKPKSVIDIATLTGGISVALGNVRGGLFTNNDGLSGALMASGERTWERLWRLPMDDEYFQLLDGNDSDIRNSGGRTAHAICGAMFLKHFVDDALPWAHLDIAGMASIDKNMPYCPKGATGFGVRLLCDYLERI